MTTTSARHRAPVPVVLAGGRGHGRWHLANMRRLERLGLMRLAGVCDLTPLGSAELAGFGAVEQSRDFARLLATTRAAVAVVCTPLHTHTDLALTAAARGVHLLLEKPPAPSLAQYERITEAVEESGVACQVGFQSLGSKAVGAIRGLLAEGAVGHVRGMGAAGAWVRDEDYFRRAPWAGRRRLEGADVVDGVLTNPLAHAMATALALDGATRAEDVARVETELFRAHAIEADDTSCVRVTTTRGRRLTVAATLCAEQPREPYVNVLGTHGRVTFWYKQDRVVLERTGHAATETLHTRTDLLENLLDHLACGVPLLVPPRETGAFMRVVEAVRTAPEPQPLPHTAWCPLPGEGAPRRVVRGIDSLVDASAADLRLYSELGAEWAVGPGAAHTAGTAGPKDSGRLP